MDWNHLLIWNSNMAIFQNNCRETKYSLPKAATQIDLGVSHNALLSLDYELIITERKKERKKQTLYMKFYKWRSKRPERIHNASRITQMEWSVVVIYIFLWCSCSLCLSSHLKNLVADWQISWSLVLLQFFAMIWIPICKSDLYPSNYYGYIKNLP